MSALDPKIRPRGELDCRDPSKLPYGESAWADVAWDPLTTPLLQESGVGAHRQVFYDMIGAIDRILPENGIPYALTAGSLLGSYRGADIIPWDDDGDITIPMEDHEKLMALRSKFADEGIVLSEGCLPCWSTTYYDTCKHINDTQCVKIAMEPPCGPGKYFARFDKGPGHVDVFHMVPLQAREGKKNMYALNARSDVIITEKQYEDLFDTVRCPFGPEEAACPKNTAELLCLNYGAKGDLLPPDNMKEETREYLKFFSSTTAGVNDYLNGTKNC
jgi:hypothetical protein